MDFKLNPPVGKSQDLFDAWLNDQFRRLTDAFQNYQDQRKGVNSITGVGVLVTGLKVVQYCMASFYDDPSPAALQLSCRPDATAGLIRVSIFAWGNTWNPSLVASTAPVNVNWIAYGF